MLYNICVFVTILFNIFSADVITYSEIGPLEQRIGDANQNTDAHESTYQESVLRRRLLPGGLTYNDKLIILNKHNAYRNMTAQGLTPNQPSASNMNQLVWDNGLAKVAANYSAQCIWAHNPNRRYQLNNYLSSTSFEYVNQFVGENLFISTGTESIDTVLRGIDFWYNENAYYTYGTVSGTATCQSGQQCGHYTQLIWANTRYVGCAYTKCATVQNLPTFTNAVLFACNYYFAGNYVGDYPYQTGTSCSKCPQDRQTCQDGLCTGCPSRSWDTYCCEYCSSSTCLNSISKGLCNSPSTCTNGITTVNSTTTKSPTTTTTTRSPTTTTKSPTTTTTTKSPTTTTTTKSPTTTTTTKSPTTTTTTKSPTTTTTTKSPTTTTTTKSPTTTTTTKSPTTTTTTKSPTTTTTKSPTTTTTTKSPTTTTKSPTTTTTKSPTISTTTTKSPTTATTTKSPTTTTTTKSPTTTTTTTTKPPTAANSASTDTPIAANQQNNCCLAYNTRYTTRCSTLTSSTCENNRKCYWSC